MVPEALLLPNLKGYAVRFTKRNKRNKHAGERKL